MMTTLKQQTLFDDRRLPGDTAPHWRYATPAPAPRPQRVQPNSAATYRALAPNLGARARAILAIFQEATRPLTDRQVRDRFNSAADMNDVRPRISELLRSGHLAPAGNTLDPVTHRPVRQTIIARTPPL